jgi:hypothetical protein
MSTKYILSSGRDGVHAALLACVRPYVLSQELVHNPKLLLDPEQLHSKADASALPLVDEMVAVLEGNAEGAQDILKASIIQHVSAHRAKMAESTGAMFHELIDVLFKNPDDVNSANVPGTATAEATKAGATKSNGGEKSSSIDELLKSLGEAEDVHVRQINPDDPNAIENALQSIRDDMRRRHN